MLLWCFGVACSLSCCCLCHFPIWAVRVVFFVGVVRFCRCLLVLMLFVGVCPCAVCVVSCVSCVIVCCMLLLIDVVCALSLLVVGRRLLFVVCCVLSLLFVVCG